MMAVVVGRKEPHGTYMETNLRLSKDSDQLYRHQTFSL